ncbi:DUF2986 domain-containing protein [Thaumasiovibrio subtropicus]|uniref:DUF2986 domain-containing protein n=1 Tax=Thaumasiovibrio subtropicus TaxID=1891207 RepID=UPI000B36301F|nr:DUF2986 domain-containing protein [Thaumasiovibrio subtropicus]
MNRKKKIKETLLKKHKKKMSRMHKANKPKYISKADRAKMEAEQAAAEGIDQNQPESDIEKAGD